MNRVRISIVIPVYNESQNLSQLFDVLDVFKDQCEIIFVDGGSQDSTLDRINQRGYAGIVSKEKGRANQMNEGAVTVTGGVLWFLHGDSIPPTTALHQIEEVLAKGHQIGCFGIRFASRHPHMKICGFLSNLRVKLRNIAFGDQGIFIQRPLFEALSGYASLPLMEDYQLSMDVKKRGLKIGMTKGKITTSERRFVANGRLRTMWMMQVLQHKFRRGKDIEEIAQIYETMRKRSG